MEIEVLGEHVEHRDEHRELNQESREALERVERMDALLAVERDGAPRALLASVGGLDGLEARLKPRVRRVHLLLETVGDERQRQDGS